jgi:hypothetical protein
MMAVGLSPVMTPSKSAHPDSDDSQPTRQEPNAKGPTRLVKVGQVAKTIPQSCAHCEKNEANAWRRRQFNCINRIDESQAAKLSLSFLHQRSGTLPLWATLINQPVLARESQDEKAD